MDIFKLRVRSIIALVLFISGIIGIVICSHFRYVPAYTEQDTGYISPFGALISVFYPGCIFLLFLSLVLLIRRTVIKVILIAVGWVILYEYIQLFLIGAYNFCVDVCIDDKDAVIAVTNHVLFYYYFVGAFCILGIIAMDAFLNKRKIQK